MQYFRFLPHPAKLRKEARWSGVSSVPDIGERIQPSADVGAGTVTAYFVDNGRLGVLVRLDIWPTRWSVKTCARDRLVPDLGVSPPFHCCRKLLPRRHARLQYALRRPQCVDRRVSTAARISTTLAAVS
jgi:hypothetical protein